MDRTRTPLIERLEELRKTHHAVIERGMPALQRLFELAEQSDSGQARRVATFLAGLYNGPRFKFDLTNLRALDHSLIEDCLAVLAMDAFACEREVHRYFEDGGNRFESMISTHGLQE